MTSSWFNRIPLLSKTPTGKGTRPTLLMCPKVELPCETAVCYTNALFYPLTRSGCDCNAFCNPVNKMRFDCNAFCCPLTNCVASATHGVNGLENASLMLICFYNPDYMSILGTIIHTYIFTYTPTIEI